MLGTIFSEDDDTFFTKLLLKINKSRKKSIKGDLLLSFMDLWSLKERTGRLVLQRIRW